MADEKDDTVDPTGDDEAQTGDDGAQAGGDGAKARRILTDIAPHSWEHPADKAALQALRKIPVFDTVLRKIFGFFGEKPIRLAFQANAVRVSENQFGEVYKLYKQALKTLDAPEEYPLYVSQTPMVNAGAYGMDQPFIILNSGTLLIIKDQELEYILGRGADGIGLFRTEFFFMEQHRAPTEDEQYRVYRDILQKAGEAGVVIRISGTRLSSTVPR